MELLRILLLILKLAGVFLTSITLLGSQRLNNIEQNIRQRIITRKYLLPTPYLPISAYKLIEKWKKFWDEVFLPFLFITIVAITTIVIVIWLGMPDNPKQSPMQFLASVVIVLLPFLIPALAFPIGFVSIIVEKIVSITKPKRVSPTDEQESDASDSQTERLENSQVEIESQTTIVFSPFRPLISSPIAYPIYPIYHNNQPSNINEEHPRKEPIFSRTKNTQEQGNIGIGLTIFLVLSWYVLGPMLSLIGLIAILGLTVSISIALLPFVLFYLIIKYLIFELHRIGISAIPYMMIAIIGFTQVIVELGVIAISKPYEWLDKQVQKRQLESTLAVIGVVITVSAEIVDYFLSR